jgi:thiol-disulfide isomerase/thioredoxin
MLNINHLLYFILLSAVTIGGCSEGPDTPKESVLKPGIWRMSMEIENGFIPLRFEVGAALNFTLLNGEERIAITDQFLEGDSLSLTMPRYESRFAATILSDSKITGSWNNLAKEDYSIPFEANYLSSTDMRGEWSADSEMKYDVTFSPGTDGAYPAIGMFENQDEDLRGTFLTETGDYRFLEGTLAGGQFTLSCFDGAHMFLFRGEMKGDSIVNGVFNSGKTYSDTWNAALNPNAILTHPDSLTYMLPGSETVAVNVMDLNGEITTIDQEDYEGRVSIIQLFGTWCPNCYDENLFYKQLYEDYSAQGFQVIPIAFEASDDFAKNAAAVKAQFSEIGIPYACYLGPKRNKKVTSEMFPMLNEIISYPTSIFIDKQGAVRKIHTGFYGPGTGEYYDEYVVETTSFIESLLAE